MLQATTEIKTLLKGSYIPRESCHECTEAKVKGKKESAFLVVSHVFHVRGSRWTKHVSGLRWGPQTLFPLENFQVINPAAFTHIRNIDSSCCTAPWTLHFPLWAAFVELWYVTFAITIYYVFVYLFITLI